MGWESIFKKSGKVFYKPHEDMNKIINLFKKEGVKKILDVGCGSGRHIVLLSKEGFDVYGMDNAESGLKRTRKWLKELGLKAKLKNASCYKTFLYKDNTFDAIIFTQVIHHAKLKEINFCISEIKRVLKPNGLVFITVTKNKMKGRASKVKIIEPRTYVMLDGPEKGVPHYIYTKTLFKKYFKNFNIFSIYTDKYNHYCLIGKLKEIAP